MEWKDERLSWDEMFMTAALTIACRSSCLYLHTGAVIVKDKRIIAEGYNGAPEGIESCVNVGCRKDKYKVDFNVKGTGTCRATHAEVNALEEISKEQARGSTIYTLYYPCNECAKIIATNGLKEVVWLKMYHGEGDLLSKEIFEEKKIMVRNLKMDIDRCLRVMRDTFSKI
jgi:dCMP deaminase